MDSLVFTAYLGSLAAMGLYAVRSKLQDDLEREIKDLREFDFNSE